MYKLIDKYIFKKFISSLIIIISSFLIIFIIVSVIDLLDKFIERQLTSREILFFYIYSLPSFISIALPMSILISTVFTFGTLQKNNEITAIKASGISIRRIGSSLLIFGILFCFISFYFQNTVIVKATQKRYEIDKKLRPNNKQLNKNRKNNIYYHLDESFIEIKRFNYKNDTGYNISIQNYSGADIIHRLDAKKMIWDTDGEIWTFKNCNVRSWKNNKISFYTLKDTSFYIEDINPEIIKRDFVKPEEMDYWELSSFISKLEDKGLDARRWKVNKHYLTAFSCIPFIMIIFGLGLSIQKPRANHALGIGLSIIVIFMYYAFITMGKNFGYNGIIPPFLSVWSTNFIFLSMGTYIFINART